MHNVLEDIKEKGNINLDAEYKEALKDNNFKLVIKSLKHTLKVI